VTLDCKVNGLPSEAVNLSLEALFSPYIAHHLGGQVDSITLDLMDHLAKPLRGKFVLSQNTLSIWN
jgi:hypothetical protein